MTNQSSLPTGDPAKPTASGSAARDAEPVISGGTTRKPSRRVPLVALVGMAVVALGLAVGSSTTGWFGDALGDVLYAVLAYVVVCLLVPTIKPLPAAVAAVIVCWAVEFFQLTGLPVVWAEQWEPARYLLGTTFAWVDLLYYVLGVAAAVGVELLIRGRRVSAR